LVGRSRREPKIGNVGVIGNRAQIAGIDNFLVKKPTLKIVVKKVRQVR
jgi:hypothetical protein